MNALETMTLILQGVVPLAVIGWAARPHRTRRSWTFDVVMAGTYLIAIGLAGLWLALPRTLVLTYAALLVGAAGYGTRRLGTGVGRPSRLARVGTWARAAALVGILAVVVAALAGRRMPAGRSVDLVFPLAGDTYLVAAGGSNVLVNPHRATARDERFRRWVGQSHAIDVVRLGSWGSREGAPSPDELERFAIFGDVVTAPCASTVVVAVDARPDVLAPGVRPAELEGNHVILECGGVWVVLAHLRRGSVGVSPGQDVRAGEPLGRVGSSGQSDGPHLHIHAQTPGTDAAPLGGDPVPMTFDGRLPRAQRPRARGA